MYTNREHITSLTHIHTHRATQIYTHAHIHTYTHAQPSTQMYTYHEHTTSPHTHTHRAAPYTCITYTHHLITRTTPQHTHKPSHTALHPHPNINTHITPYTPLICTHTTKYAHTHTPHVLLHTDSKPVSCRPARVISLVDSLPLTDVFYRHESQSYLDI